MQLLSMLTEIQYFKISIRQCSKISPPVAKKSVIWLVQKTGLHLSWLQFLLNEGNHIMV